MGLTRFPHGISSLGIPVFGGGTQVPVSTGSYFFVDSQTGNAAYNGSDPSQPLATIAQALAKCTANKGDVIIVMPGHTSTVPGASGLNINVAGVTIIGLGSGSLRPTITLNTAATATIAISAANVTIKNVIVTANFADIAVAIVTSAKNIRLEAVDFLETATNMNFLSCIATSATANASDGLQVVGCHRAAVDAASLAFISILANTDRLYITNNMDTQASAADVGHFIIFGSFVTLDAMILGNILNLTGDNNAQTVGVFATGTSTTSTGIMAYNLCSDLDTGTELFDTATLDFGHFENYKSGTIALSGRITPPMEAA
jgi:hypothetical protein